MKNPGFQINGRPIGAQKPVYIIAEMSANHLQDYDRAVKILKAAHDAGADAIKVQTYRPDTITLDSTADPFILEAGPWEGRNLYELYEEAYMPWDWQPKLQRVADELGITLFSTADDESAVDFLEDMNVPAYKLASFEIVDLPLVRKIASTGKPLIMSTGMATLGEIEEAVTAAQEAGTSDIALLKCTSAYPAPVEDLNLATIKALREIFGVPTGLSDHTLDVVSPITSVALGACIIEKHLTLSREDGGPDAGFSLEPDEFSRMVDVVRATETAVGGVDFGPSDSETNNRDLRPSLWITDDIAAGEELTRGNVDTLRPADGLHPRHLPDVLGRTAQMNLERGTPLSWDLVGSSPKER